MVAPRPSHGRSQHSKKVAAVGFAFCLSFLLAALFLHGSRQQTPRLPRAYMYSSQVTRTMCDTLRGLLFNGWQVTVLGGVSDPSLRSKDIMWHRMEGKMLVPMKWMQRQSVDDIIVWVDAYDVVTQAGPEEVLRKYRAMDAEVVYSAELNCWPFSHWGNRERANKTCERYPPTPRSRQPRYINTGVIVGRAGTMVRLVKTLNNLLTYHRKDFQQGETQMDDQGMAAFVFLSGAFDSKLDYYSEITKNMFMAEQDVEPNVMGGRRVWRDKTSGSTPVFLHSNGGKMPFYNLNGSMWYDVAHARLPESAAVYAFDGTALPFRTICPGVVM